MKRRGNRRSGAAGRDAEQRFAERLAAAWSWGPDPVKTLLFVLLAPALLLAGTLGGMDWTWWQRLLAGVGGLVLTTYVLLVLLGLRRIRRNRKAQARRAP